MRMALHRPLHWRGEGDPALDLLCECSRHQLGVDPRACESSTIFEVDLASVILALSPRSFSMVGALLADYQPGPPVDGYSGLLAVRSMTMRLTCRPWASAHAGRS